MISLVIATGKPGSCKPDEPNANRRHYAVVAELADALDSGFGAATI